MNGNIEWIPSYKNAKEISLQVMFSKTNKKGDKLEKVYVRCNCKDETAVIPCTVCHLKYWIKFRNNFHHKKFKTSDFLLILKNGKPFRYDHLNNFMYNAIVNLNKRLNLQFNPHHYPPHSLRLGGCTDMARYGEPGWKIEAQGRWTSEIWKKTYINMDWTDIAKLNNCTVGELLSKVQHRPYSK